MSKHTAGPWKAVEVGDTGGENPMPIYEVQTAGGHKRICEYIRPDDARLCAAAPELLEALKKCAAVCAGETMHKNGLIEALDAARAAIRKATGE